MKQMIMILAVMVAGVSAKAETEDAIILQLEQLAIIASGNFFEKCKLKVGKDRLTASYTELNIKWYFKNRAEGYTEQESYDLVRITLAKHSRTVKCSVSSY